jgi:hypothetical protein
MEQASLVQQWRGERVREAQPKEEEGGYLYPPRKSSRLGKNRAGYSGPSWGRIIRGPDNPASGTKPGQNPAKNPAPIQSCFSSGP